MEDVIQPTKLNNCLKESLKQRSYKVTVIGAAGENGKLLSLLLKINPFITNLALYDISPITPGIAMDVSHLNTPAKVSGFKGHDQLEEALKGSDVVMLLACLGTAIFFDRPSYAKSEGVPAKKTRKPGLTRDDLFNLNAPLIRDLTTTFGKVCPEAMLAIVTNPVNSLVPVAAEVLYQMGVFDKNRVFGVTTLDSMRSSVFIGEINDVDPRSVTVPVIGGHAGTTIIPVLSQSDPPVKLKDETMAKKLIERIQKAGFEVIYAKAGGGTATLSMAYATAHFVNSLLRGLEGESDIVECAYVSSEVTKALFFATPLVLGRCGVEKNLGLGCLNSYEESLVKAAIPELKKNIEQGIKFVKSKS